MEICLAAERRLGVQVSMGWFEQSSIEIRQGDPEKNIDPEEEEEGEGDDTEREAKERRGEEG